MKAMGLMTPLHLYGTAQTSANLLCSRINLTQLSDQLSWCYARPNISIPTIKSQGRCSDGDPDIHTTAHTQLKYLLKPTDLCGKLLLEQSP